MSVNLQSEIFSLKLIIGHLSQKGLVLVRSVLEKILGLGDIRINTEQQTCAVVRVSVHQKEWVRTV